MGFRQFDLSFLHNNIILYSPEQHPHDSKMPFCKLEMPLHDAKMPFYDCKTPFYYSKMPFYYHELTPGSA